MKKIIIGLTSLIGIFVFVVSAYAATTIVVTPADLEVPADSTIPQQSWYFYNDNNNTASVAEVPDSYEFVSGIDNPPSGEGSIKFAVPAGGRWTIATNQFAGISLADLGELAFTIYRPDTSAGSTQTTLFFNFDIDFDNIVANGYQGRLVYVPANNGSVTENMWETWDMDQGMWSWSRYVSNGNQWPDGDTNVLRSWSEIVAKFPNAEVLHETFTGQMLVRAGHPGPDGLVGYLDSIVVGGVTYDFEPTLTPVTKDVCKKGGWMTFNTPVFKNQGDCVSFVVSNSSH